MAEHKFPWGDTRRFNSYTSYFKKKFGTRVQKLSLNAGFTCPNRDGTISTGGCNFCLNEAFNPSYCDPLKPILTQINEGIEFHTTRYRRAEKYIAYFQAYSNTHKPVEELKEIYSQALDHPLVSGIVIGTRPDCIDERKLDYFAELSEKTCLIIEYGIESCYNKTLESLNRGHKFEQTVQALEETAKRGIHTGGHIIFGLPGESQNEMLDEAEILSGLKLNSIKFHQLQIFKGTVMEKQFSDNPEKFNLFQPEEYIDFIIKFTERLNPAIVIERFASETPPRYLANGTGWDIRNYIFLQMIEKKMEELDTWQGKKY
ncbi:MAG: TIGR01212 family radical SAM protein [Bacteroidetes bacterium GWF2_38_335]|nr:MAG: TIGR01212 family radical SAM protein [Bacteroidetes bacterium GWF2_38_335]OFY80492.1 MAG: TIGR01212 family radical SAM protein [Bacteroidetes bacterium RIFOXYA12_FULL_38_20]HBS85899.1 TIGR01212 family radical SAM protein [Bacteroidales bacterium]